MLLMVFLLSMPFFAFAQADQHEHGLTYECFTGTGDDAVYGNCTWTDLVAATMNVINKVIPIAIGFSVVVIAWAGFIYMTEGSTPGGRARANKMFRNVGIGIFFIIAAWMIVNLISNALLSNSVPRIIDNPN